MDRLAGCSPDVQIEQWEGLISIVHDDEVHSNMNYMTGGFAADFRLLSKHLGLIRMRGGRYVCLERLGGQISLHLEIRTILG